MLLGIDIFWTLQNLLWLFVAFNALKANICSVITWKLGLKDALFTKRLSINLPGIGYFLDFLL